MSQRIAGTGSTNHVAVAAPAITGDLEIRWTMALDSYTTTQYVFDRVGSAGSVCWRVYISSDTLNFQWSEDGTNLVSTSATGALGLVAGTEYDFKILFDVDDGAAGRNIKHYVDGGLERDHTQAGVTSIANVAYDIRVLGRHQGTSATGTVKSAQVYDGIGGTLIANLDPTDTTDVSDTATWTDSESRTWTANGSGLSLQYDSFKHAQHSVAAPGQPLHTGG